MRAARRSARASLTLHRERRTLMAYRPLNAIERRYLCSFIRALVPVARDSSHPMRELARKQIALTLWRWTADAVRTDTGIVKQDAHKYNTTVHAATRDAIADSASGGAGLRHEHVVPRIVLADQIITLDLQENDIFVLLTRFCVAAIVTVAEDRRLRPKNAMPSGWSWNGGDPYARYAYSNLDTVLRRPFEAR